jgi:cytochrome b involved in lipid metabolism
MLGILATLIAAVVPTPTADVDATHAKDSNGDVNKQLANVAAVPTVLFRGEDVAAHDKLDDLWICIHGIIYDVTLYAPDHPGGADLLLAHAGQDATDAFDDAAHSTLAVEMLAKYKVGELTTSIDDMSSLLLTKRRTSISCNCNL